MAFVAFARTTTGMVTGSPPGVRLASPYRGRRPLAAGRRRWSSGLAALLVLGLWIPAGLDTVILHSMAVIG